MNCRPLHIALMVTAVGVACVGGAWAQGIDPLNRPVADVRLKGLRQVDPQLVFNTIRVKKGDPYNATIVQQDIARLTQLNKFLRVEASIEPQGDGSVILFYEFSEQQLISDVQVVGNYVLPDQQLLEVIRLRAGDPADDFLIDRAKKQVVTAYKQAGHFDATVGVDEPLLAESGILLFRVVEGPRLRIRAIRFQGNTKFTAKQLKSRIRSKTYIFMLRKGELSREGTQEDAGRLREFYRQRGYLDAQVVREIEMSPDGRDAIVMFTLQEGEQYTVAKIEIEGNSVFNDQSIIEAMALRVGDVFATNQLEASERRLVELYGQLGYIEMKLVKADGQMGIDRLFHENESQVDLFVRVVEGKPYWVGKIEFKGNQLTKDKVLLRQIRDLRPGQPFVGAGINRTKQRLNRSPLFKSGRTQVTVLGNPGDEVRDVLIEVEEQNTGSLGLGAGISSDSGVVGSFNITQRNFDITDTPDSVGEFFTGKWGKGAGQYLRILLEPGSATSRYQVTFREPYVFDSNIFLDTTGFFFERERRDYDEQRAGGNVSFGQRFGDVWSASIQTRYELIDITNIDVDAAVDVFDVMGESEISSLALSVSRSTVDNRLSPTQGSTLRFNLSRAGAIGGDYNFTRASVGMHKFWTVDEDFFGRRTVVSARIGTGYIFEDDEAPVFERFYVGGHRSLRGFEFRGIGPRGDVTDVADSDGDGLTTDTVPGDDPVGGDWMFLFSLEYNFPIYQEVIRGVMFMDTGTVEEDVGFEDYRVAIGVGIRLTVPALGQVPFAFDLAIPIAAEDNDEEQVFSFDIAVPF